MSTKYKNKSNNTLKNKYKKTNFKKAQGEIFGIALMFVVIIIGIIIFSKISALSPDREGDLEAKGKYEILAQTSLDTILKTSSGCNADGGSSDDTVQDLLNICLARSYDGDDVEVSCGGNNVFVCEYALKALNKSLHNVFNGSDALIANIPFFLEIELEANTESILTSTNITNFGSVISKYKRKNVIVNATNYRVFGFKKASSDLFVWATAQREIKVLLALYFK